MPAAYTSIPSVQVLDFEVICLLIRHGSLLCSFCSSGQRFAFGSLKTFPHGKALSVQLTVPPVGSVEDLHLQVDAPCRAHKQKDHKGSTPPSRRALQKPPWSPGINNKKAMNVIRFLRIFDLH